MSPFPRGQSRATAGSYDDDETKLDVSAVNSNELSSAQLQVELQT
jgi:hypothetical protein